MLKNILKLAGVKELSKNEQRNVKGGWCGDGCDPAESCCHLARNGCVYHCTPTGQPGSCSCL